MMKLFVSELGHFGAVFIVLLYFLAFYVRWMQSYRVGHGHFIIGMFSVGITFMTLLVTMFAYDFFQTFVLGDLLATVMWLLYNDWYFWKYPVSVEVLIGIDPAQAPGADTRLGQFLRQKQSERPDVFGQKTWLTGLGVIMFLVFGFGFYRVVTVIVQSERVATQAQARTTREVRKFVGQATNQLQQSLQEATDTLTDIATDARLQAQKAAVQAAANAKQGKQDRATIEQKLNRNLKATERTRQSIVTPRPLSTPMRATFSLPATERVKQLPASPPPRKRGKFSFRETYGDEIIYTLADTLIYP